MKKIIAIALIGMMSSMTLLAKDVVTYDKPKVDKPVFKPNHPNTGKDVYDK